jgi:hypothetical protein
MQRNARHWPVSGSGCEGQTVLQSALSRSPARRCSPGPVPFTTPFEQRGLRLHRVTINVKPYLLCYNHNCHLIHTIVRTKEISMR